MREEEEAESTEYAWGYCIEICGTGHKSYDSCCMVLVVTGDQPLQSGNTAIILAQGDEIVGGRTLDTNSRWIAQQLSELGVRVVGLAAAPDDIERLADLMRDVIGRVDFVVSTGGLGPTEDDYSADAAARALGRRIVEDGAALEQIRARFLAMGKPMPEVNKKQALVPEGATILENSVGTAPGFVVSQDGTALFFLPGVPSEMRHLFAVHVQPWLEERGLSKPLRKSFHVCGIGESALQEMLGGVTLAAGIRMGFQTHLPFNTVFLYGEQKDAMEQAAQQVRIALGDGCCGEDDRELVLTVGEMLVRRGWSLGVAESCTGGGLGAMITDYPGVSSWFHGGVVAYENAVKVALLGVSQEILDHEGAVSEPCAVAMAEGVRRAIGVDVGVSITGIAGPDGGSPDKPVGTVCIGLALPSGLHSRTVSFPGFGRGLVRSFSAATALEWLRRRLLKEG